MNIRTMFFIKRFFSAHSFLIIAVIVLFVLAIAKDQIIKAAVTIGASRVVGASVHIDGMSVGLFRHVIHIKGFKIHNPSGFPSGIMIDVGKVSADYDLPAILKGDLHLSFLVLDLKEMVVIRNKEGRLNVDALRVAQKGPTGPEKQQAMRIDTVTLTLDQVIVKDYTISDWPAVQVFDIGIRDKTYHHIKSAEQLAALVMVESLNPTNIKDAAIYGAARVLNVPVGVVDALYRVLNSLR